MPLGFSRDGFLHQPQLEVVAIKTKVNTFCLHFGSHEPIEAGIAACASVNRWNLVGFQKA